MSLLLCVAVAILFAAPLSAGDAPYDEVVLNLPGPLIATRIADVDGLPDGQVEVVMVVRNPETDRRELHIHHLDPSGGLRTRPTHVIPVLEDVIAWAAADVRPDPGRELLFLTRSGAWSYSTSKEGYRGNIERLVEADLLYDVADPRHLPAWRYVVEAEGGDLLLLPDRDGLALWEPDPGGDTYREAARLDVIPTEDQDDGYDEGDFRLTIGGDGGVRTVYDSPHVFAADTPEFLAPPLLSSDLSVRSPALVDVDGDGRDDLVRRRNKGLAVYLADATGRFTSDATRMEPYPTALAGDDDQRLELIDLDDDGDVDILARVQPDRESVMDGDVPVSLLVFLNDGQRLMSEQPAQVLRVEAAQVFIRTGDVDGDSTLDLVITKVTSPDWLAMVNPAQLEFGRATLVFFGDGRGTFERKPSVRREDVFGTDTISAAIARQRLLRDFTGDGLADLLDVDLEGRASVYPLRHSSSFFGGETWELERAPSRRFNTRLEFGSIVITDLNGDDLGDVISRRDDALVVLLSRGGGDR